MLYDLCVKWFYCGCEKVTSIEYKKLKESSKSSLTRWFCRKSDSSFRDMKRENLIELEYKIDSQVSYS